MNPWVLGGIVLGLTLAGGRPALAQSPIPGRPFVDAAAMTERDPTEFFYGSDSGIAGRGAVGVHLSGPNGLRFEVDVPRWRVLDTASASPVWCAEGAHCVGGVGYVPARTTSHDAVRTVSYSLLYARELPAMGRVLVSLVAGGGVEKRAYRSSGSFDELGADGRVVRHSAFDNDRSKDWFAAVFGIDAEVRLSSHLAVTPQVRFHTFPYPKVSIVRPGVAVRWRF
jgi:hypothetical protein